MSRMAWDRLFLQGLRRPCARICGIKSSETILKFQRDCDRDDTRPQLSRMHLLKRQGMIFGLEDDAAGRRKLN